MEKHASLLEPSVFIHSVMEKLMATRFSSHKKKGLCDA
jgi:hypothetical protein